MASFHDTNRNIKKLFYIGYRFYYFLCLLSEGESEATLDSGVKLECSSSLERHSFNRDKVLS